MKKIREIFIGVNPKDCLYYYMGQTVYIKNVPTFEITDIIEAQTLVPKFLQFFTKYYIYAKNLKTHEIELWYKTDGLMPVLVKYEMDV